MARKAIVDRETVLQMLREGKTSKAIAEQFGVSRQAIDLYRKQFANSKLLNAAPTSTPQVSSKPKDLTVDHPIPQQMSGSESVSYPTQPTAAHPALSLDDLVDLIIQAFTALKRVKELEVEIAGLRKNYDAVLQQVEQLQAREQKRREQEARWIHAQAPGIMTSQE
jgi:hypothetical protein